MDGIIEVELPDGNVAEFPENTPIAEIEAATLDYSKNVSAYPEDMPLPDYSTEGYEVQEPGNDPTKRPAWEQFKRDIPALVGGIAAPLLTSKIPGFQQMGQAAQRATQVGAAGVGGAIGETIQATKEYVTGDENAPETIADATVRARDAGVEQAVFEGIGQLAIKTGGYVVNAVKPKVSELSKSLYSKFADDGGELTAAQVSDSWWIKQLDSLTRGSITASGVYKGADVANIETFKVMEKSLIKNIAEKASTDLSDDALGKMFVTQVNGGRAAHSAAASQMYKNIDDLLETAGGSKIGTAYLKQISEDTLKQLERVGNVGSGEVDMQLLKQLKSLPDDMSFQDASFLRSSLLAMQRDLDGVIGSGRADRVIGQAVTSINTSMEKAATIAGDDVLKAYNNTNRFWRKGKQTFDNKFIANLINANKKNPERIGETVFRDGNVTEIYKVRKALKTASKLDKSINPQEVWHGMQAGYLQSLLTKVSNAEGVVQSNRLLKTFVDRKKGRTLTNVFTKEQRDKIVEFAMIGEKLQKKPETGLGMVMNLAQAGTVMDLASFRVIDPATASVILIAPRVVSYALTNPKIVNLMTKSMKTEYETTLGKQLATKLSAEIIKIKNEIEE